MDGADWLRTQLTSFGCAACGQAYESGRIRVLAEREGLFFVDLGCARCGSRAVAIVTIQLGDDESATTQFGELTATREPLVERVVRSPVGADDVLDIHSLLDGFEGDVDQLLRRLDGVVGPGAR